MEEYKQPERHFTLTAGQVARLNPNTKTSPIFRTKYDAELTAKIHNRVPVLIGDGKEDGNPWGISFMAMFHMANDSGLFLAEPGPGRVPLLEAKMIHQFDHRWCTYDGGETRDLTPQERASPSFEPTPRYWVDEAHVRERLADRKWNRRWLIGWRDTGRSTDERTLIASLFPHMAVSNKLPLMLPQVEPRDAALLVGAINSLVFDYVARQKVGGATLNMFLVKQFASPAPSQLWPSGEMMTARVLELLYTSHSLAGLARDLGYDGPPFAWNEDRRAQLRAELDAGYARAYGLTRHELRYILDPSDVLGDDYPSETFRVLKNNEMKKFGEYRTRRLVLEAWDRMEAGDLK